MENASDAIIMAGSVFLLLIALTLGITTFSRVKTQIDDIVTSRQKVEYAIDTNSEENNSLLNFIKSKNEYTRTVQIETIVTTLRRIRKENFDVYIWFEDLDNGSDFPEEIRKVLKNDENFADIQVSRDEIYLRFSLSGTANRYVEDKNSDNFDKVLKMLYNKVGNKKFKEYYGIYKEKTDEGVSDVEKSDNKIITYIESNE